MSESTPGPWEIIELPSLQYRIDARHGPLHVCPAIANSLPDAHLIAAAPDLLAIAQRWSSLDGGSWHVERHDRRRTELIVATRRAIAKATGVSTT